ncbi:hypothetical protein HanRHA438_Chr13g0626831 [Helianthus annuus]|nr:hypothetical protein HanRHA438_Chr13g0626831 [Helianthus annuus]
MCVFSFMCVFNPNSLVFYSMITEEGKYLGLIYLLDTTAKEYKHYQKNHSCSLVVVHIQQHLLGENGERDYELITGKDITKKTIHVLLLWTTYNRHFLVKVVKEITSLLCI